MAPVHPSIRVQCTRARVQNARGWPLLPSCRIVAGLCRRGDRGEYGWHRSRAHRLN